MVKLCLGSANFGTKYGLDNKKVDKNHTSKIIDIALNNKIFAIDTSFEYFKSHDVLKKKVGKKTILNTKIFLNKNNIFIFFQKKILNFNKILIAKYK